MEQLLVSRTFGMSESGYDGVPREILDTLLRNLGFPRVLAAEIVSSSWSASFSQIFSQLAGSLLIS